MLGDSFLSKIVPQIMASEAYRNDGAIVIGNDETEGGDDARRTSMEIVISPSAKGNGYQSNLIYTHSSDLKTLQEIYGVGGGTDPSGLLGDAASAGTNDLSDLFGSGTVPTTVPEPASTITVLLGGLGLLMRHRRR